MVITKGKMQWQIQGRGPRPALPPPPLFLDHTEARRAGKIFFLVRAPPYLRVWMTALPPPTPLSEGVDPPLNMCALRKPLLVIEITKEATYN